MSRDGRLATSAIVGFSTLLPGFALEALWRSPEALRSTSQWVAALIVPATLAVALMVALLVRSFSRPTRPFPLVALAVGATLGFFVGRMLVAPVWGVAFATRGTGVQALAFLQVAIAATAGAYASTRAAQASARRAT
jgi:hypothetical protein